MLVWGVCTLHEKGESCPEEVAILLAEHALEDDQDGVGAGGGRWGAVCKLKGLDLGYVCWGLARIGAGAGERGGRVMASIAQRAAGVARP